MRTRYTVTYDALGTGFCVEAESGQACLGQASMDDHPSPMEWLTAHDPALAAEAARANVAVNHLHMLSVERKYRGQGVATRLMRRFVRCADDAGIGIVTLYCMPQNGEGGPDAATLVAFYSRFGFVDTGQREDGAPLLARKSPRVWPATSKKARLVNTLR